MGLLIDASVFIAHERGRLDLEATIRRPSETVFVSVITASELLHGVHRACTPLQRDRRAAFVDAILKRFPILGTDLIVARTHAKLWATLAGHGITIGAHDLWIGAQAVALGHGVLTVNVRDFARIPGLKISTIRSK